jgi:predicted DNA-binding ribbon-helix-helix protein
MSTRYFKIDGKNTSVRVEDPFWEAFDEVCRGGHILI